MGVYVVDLATVGMSDIEVVGGKNASLGEMIGQLSGLGVQVPGGFATTALAYRDFLAQAELADRIHARLDALDTEDVDALVATGKEIREWVRATPLPERLDRELREFYGRLASDGTDVAVAVRSSATAEDLPEASFAGQQETFLNVCGVDSVIRCVKEVFASLYNDRAISYRVHHGFRHADVALSAGIQRMVRADIGASGVIFTIDTESGFPDVVFVTASWGLGELVVQGAVNPDEFYVYKPALSAGKYPILRRTMGTKLEKMIYADSPGDEPPVRVVPVTDSDRRRFCLTDDDLQELARQAVVIEKHYGRPMDIEWGKDGEDGHLYILQARPETVKSRTGQFVERYRLQGQGRILTEGRAIGQRIGTGTARVVQSISEMARVREGDVLVADMTDPDWEPIMKRASAIVTNRGGRTCHAAIIARELGIPAVVGCGNATRAIQDGEGITVSCAEGDAGFIYAGELPYDRQELDLETMPEIPVDIMMNVGNPDRAFDFSSIPHRGIGLARVEFIINRMIGVHPKALINFDAQPDDVKATIQELAAGYPDPVSFYVDRLSEGIATLAAAFAPHPVIVRMSDFKSNEYANLVGGAQYEPDEENPMLGFRGAARYVSEGFRDCFELEVRAIRRVREDMGLENVQVMIPFLRTVGEAEAVTRLLAETGLRRGEKGLKLIMMCELPSNALLADEFLEYFDGFSIGSNDLTQLTLGLDRDSGLIAHLFDERDPAVLALLSMAIQACRKKGKYVGICGQGPSDHPDLARWLVNEGIDSISLNPDTVVQTWLYLAGQAVD